MNKKTLIVVVLLLIAAALYLRLQEQETRKICFENQKCVKTELATTPEEQARGLMFRNQIDADHGMLFIFPDERIHTFWMKNTLIPLDIIWINSSRQVVHIEHAVPCIEDPCRVYTPNENAKYVLEVRENYTLENNITLGEQTYF